MSTTTTTTTNVVELAAAEELGQLVRDLAAVKEQLFESVGETLIGWRDVASYSGAALDEIAEAIRSGDLRCQIRVKLQHVENWMASRAARARVEAASALRDVVEDANR